MIRFIDLGNQIYPYDTERDSFLFAWWNTITDSFQEFNDNQAWDSWEEFEDDWLECFGQHKEIERYRSLFPKDWPKMERWREDFKPSSKSIGVIAKEYGVPYSLVHALEKRVLDDIERPTVTRVDVEQLLERLTSLNIPMPPTSTFYFALAELGVKIIQ